MKVSERAARFVDRADQALSDIGNASEIWAATVGSKSDEVRLHGLAIELDNAIRKVSGKFDAWASLDPSQVDALALNGPINLLWVVSAHPSGRVREAFVHSTKHAVSDQVLPHLANRAIDFVPAIRDAAGSLVMAKLGDVLVTRTGPENHGVLPTAAHIAVKKLLAPRTAVVSPDLIGLCLDLANTASLTKPGSLSEGKLDRMLERCRQTMASSSEASTVEAIESLMGYFTANAISK